METLSVIKTSTYIKQMDEDTMLDMVRFVEVIGGWIERIAPIPDDPEMFSVLCQLPREPLTFSQVTAYKYR